MSVSVLRLGAVIDLPEHIERVTEKFQAWELQPGETRRLYLQPQRIFRPEQLICESDARLDVMIEELRIGHYFIASRLVLGGPFRVQEKTTDEFWFKLDAVDISTAIFLTLHNFGRTTRSGNCRFVGPALTS